MAEQHTLEPDDHAPTTGWVGASVLRKEDARHLDGKGMFVADVIIPRTREIAFVRSNMAHATLIGVTKPEGHAHQVFTAADLGEIDHLTAGPEIAAFRNTVYPPLAEGRVRFAGQTVAMCVAGSRAEAEDLADQVGVDLDPLAVVIDAVDAMKPGAAKVYDSWQDGAFMTSAVKGGDVKAARGKAKFSVRRQFKMARQTCNSLEGRGVLAYYDRRLDELVVYMSTQGPHVMRMALAQCLKIPEHKLRVIAPDVGGGFGGKNRLTPEEIAVVALARQVDYPVRWIEDRREHILASAHAREHWYDITLHADAEGTFLGLEGEVYVDAGAYSLWPVGAFAEASMAARNLPGPYRIQDLEIRNFTVATNKAPLGPYRGVARPGACFVIERMVDELAHEMGIDPMDLRQRNIVTAAELPYTTVGEMVLDTGDYPASLRGAIELINSDAVRARQKQGEPDGRRIGLGFAFYTEQSGHGTAEWTRRKSRVVPGYESCVTRMMPDGTVLLLVGIQSHGQGMETTLAQIAAHELGLKPAQVQVRHGDTGISPFGFGTFASRSIVMAGGAVAKSSRQLADKLRAIGAKLLQCAPEDTTLADGQVMSGSGGVSFAEIGRAAHVRSELLPEDVDPVLEEFATYEPSVSGGAFSYATHAAVVAVDPDTGSVELLDYAVCEDCGTMINPLIVDGQVMGGVTQGIGTALFEEIPYDEQGQPLATTLAEYLLPCASELPRIRVKHLVTPSTFTEYGVKGVGEGGAIAPPGAIVNAISDAFKETGAFFNTTPCTPRRIVAALDAARDAHSSHEVGA
ncbi:MAG TPA: xanthine dehydrogenase family protein molybdopterin-binding subunit [Stellaceae bacterium]|nr:xanthine dehydrogenase family protein molybdopterin-binding subunit [Stellaceae bacterium]